MTARKRHLLAVSLAAAGLLTGGVAQAADWDVSTIYGRGAPPTAHWTGPSGNTDTTVTSRQAPDDTTMSESSRSAQVPQAYPEHASYTRDSASMPGEGTWAEGTIHEQNLDGTPLVDGRGMREDVDHYAAPAVRSEPLFEVADILGRSSPPAPESAADDAWRS